jgi:hypothetical protein
VTARDGFLDPLEDGGGPALEHHAKMDACLGTRLDHVVCTLQGQRHGFFDENVLSGGGSGDGLLLVLTAGGADAHTVHVWVVQDLVVRNARRAESIADLIEPRRIVVAHGRKDGASVTVRGDGLAMKLGRHAGP